MCREDKAHGSAAVLCLPSIVLGQADTQKYKTRRSTLACGIRLERSMQGLPRPCKQLYWLAARRLMRRSHHLITVCRRRVAHGTSSAYWSTMEAAGSDVALHAYAMQCKIPPSRWLESALLQCFLKRSTTHSFDHGNVQPEIAQSPVAVSIIVKLGEIEIGLHRRHTCVIGCTRFEQTRRKWVCAPRPGPSLSANSTPEGNDNIDDDATNGAVQTLSTVI